MNWIILAFYFWLIFVSIGAIAGILFLIDMYRHCVGKHPFIFEDWFY